MGEVCVHAVKAQLHVLHVHVAYCVSIMLQLLAPGQAN